MQLPLTTTIRDVLDPLTGKRRSVQFAGARQLAPGSQPGVPPGREIDGSSWWILPALYDADSNLQLLPAGLRRYDLTAALFGGIHHLNAALPWQLLRGHDLEAIIGEAGEARLPRISLVLSVTPGDDSAEFPGWLTAHRTEVTELLAPVCRLFTADPHFERNIDAVWSAGMTPAVFCASEADLARLVGRARALHFRHATSASMLEAIRQVPGATVQTCPHLLLPLAPGRRDRLNVLPKPPADADRETLVRELVAGVDVIASDHVSLPLGPPTSPGLQTQQHFLPALLTVCSHYGLDIADVWPKATSGPARVFGVKPEEGFVVVDPGPVPPVGQWPRQAEDRAPYLGLELRGRVIAVGSGEGVALP